MDGEPSSLWYLAGGLLLAKGMSRDTSDEGAPRTAATQNIAKLKANAATCAILGWIPEAWRIPWIYIYEILRYNEIIEMELFQVIVAPPVDPRWLGASAEWQHIGSIQSGGKHWFVRKKHRMPTNLSNILRLRPCQKHHGQPVQSNYGKKSCSIWFND